MKLPFKPMVAALALSGFAVAPAIAATESTTSTLSSPDSAQFAKSVEEKLLRLQKEVSSLRSQLKGRQLKSHHMYAGPHQNTVKGTTNDNANDLAHTSDVTATPIANSQKLTGKELAKLISESRDYLPFDLDVPGQAFVSSGPYIGLRIQFAGDNLIVNSPSVNLDVRLLDIRKSILSQLAAMGGELNKEPEHSHLLLSGVVEGQVGYINHSGPANGGLPASYIDLSSAIVDFTILGPSEWLTGFIEMAYDDNPPYATPYVSTSSYTVYNSRLYLNKGFITIGDFAKSPVYGTIGQYYVPFGVYSTYMISDTFTKVLGRTKARAILLGFQQQSMPAWYGSIFAFRGDSHAPATTRIDNGGANLGFRFTEGIVRANIGGSVIANIADSGGMQVGNGFQNAEQLKHTVPAYNVRGTLGIGEHIDFLAECIVAAKRFNPYDMSYQNHGAQPWAVDAEASYSFTIFDNKPSAIGVGYEHSAEALAIGLPQNRYSLVLNTSLLRNTLQTIEFRHDIEYAASKVANGAADQATTPQTGKSDNAVTAQFDLFF